VVSFKQSLDFEHRLVLKTHIVQVVTRGVTGDSDPFTQLSHNCAKGHSWIVYERRLSMPTSQPHQLNEIMELIVLTRPKNVLKVGVGLGKYGARETILSILETQ